MCKPYPRYDKVPVYKPFDSNASCIGCGQKLTNGPRSCPYCYVPTAHPDDCPPHGPGLTAADIDRWLADEAGFLAVMSQATPLTDADLTVKLDALNMNDQPTDVGESLKEHDWLTNNQGVFTADARLTPAHLLLLYYEMANGVKLVKIPRT